MGVELVMWKWVGILIILLVFGGGGYYLWPRENINPVGNGLKPFLANNLEKYDFDNLRKRGGKASEINILGLIDGVEKRRTKKYGFTTKEIRFQSDGKWVSGMINMPNDAGTRHGVFVPIIIMIRGYAEKQWYYPGSGTWKVADELAKAGYATISLDFLGYGDSDMESTDMLEARFHKVIEVLDLIVSVKQLPWVDKNRIGIWAHSNGGQIVLSVLEITGEKYSTVLWAPMTMPFPDSVLSTIDEGSPVKEAIDEFQKHYDARRYAFENYYQWIQAPILIQQGMVDEWVKVEWQQDLQSRLKLLGKYVELVIYPGADHNLKNSWDEGVKKDLEWYGEKFVSQ